MNQMVKYIKSQRCLKTAHITLRVNSFNGTIFVNACVQRNVLCLHVMPEKTMRSQFVYQQIF